MEYHPQHWSNKANMSMEYFYGVGKCHEGSTCTFGKHLHNYDDYGKTQRVSWANPLEIAILNSNASHFQGGKLSSI